MKAIYAAAAAVFLSLAGITADAAEITADVLTYNGETKTARAQGNVVIHGEDGAVMTGESGEYNFDSRAAYLTGGVAYQKGVTSLQADTVQMAGDKTMHGVGGVVIHDGDKTLTGDAVTYNTDTGYGLVEGNGFVSMPDGQVWAPHIEGNLKAIRITADGGVQIQSDVHELTGAGRQAVYTKSPDADDGLVVLTGDATATQRGNTITGPELYISLKENSVETKGRSTLVITNTSPQ